MLKQALQSYKDAVNVLPREDDLLNGPPRANGWHRVVPTGHAPTRRTHAGAVGGGFPRRSVRTLQDEDTLAWAVSHNNLAATMQAVGEHEEDIGALEACISAYDQVLKVISAEQYPLVAAMIAANRASAMSALAGESDYLDMAEAASAEFDRLSALLAETSYENYCRAAQARAEAAREIVSALQV